MVSMTISLFIMSSAVLRPVVAHWCLLCIYGAYLLIERSPRRHLILRQTGQCNDNMLPMNVNGWWTFIIEWVNQAAVLSSVNGHSAISLFVTGTMSFITSGMHNYRSVDTLIPSNKLVLGGPICHDVTCVACVWIKNTDRIVLWAYIQEAIPSFMCTLLCTWIYHKLS